MVTELIELVTQQKLFGRYLVVGLYLALVGAIVIYNFEKTDYMTPSKRGLELSTVLMGLSLMLIGVLQVGMLDSSVLVILAGLMLMGSQLLVFYALYTSYNRLRNSLDTDQ